MAPPRTKTGIGNRAPVHELGTILGGALSPAGMAPWTQFFVDTQEFVPDLMWPRSVQTYEQMRADSQLSALYKATVLGIMKFKWSIDPNGQEEMAMKLSKDYNLPVLGARTNERYRQKRRFAFKNHMRKAFYAGIYGHYPFEQLGTIEDDDGMWHLRKLAERPPRTIQNFRVKEDGGLISIIQNLSKNGQEYWGTLPEIPIDRLVMYVWEQEGANWSGRSWFRECYKNWVIKDRLLRVDAINHERAGGVPYIEAHPGATFDEVSKLNEMAKSFRIGDTSGGAVPSGAKIQIARGTNSSVVESIKYHDESMARTWMLMVMQLGQTETGSRALGRTFIDFWGHGLSSIADWFKDTFNEHVIEDDIDWNYGEEVDKVPLLTYEFDPEFVIGDIKTAIDAKVIVVDDELEFYIRKELGLPEKSTPRLDPATHDDKIKEDQLKQTADLAQQAADTQVTVAKEASKAPKPGTPQPVVKAGRVVDAPSRPFPAETGDGVESPTIQSGEESDE